MLNALTVELPCVNILEDNSGLLALWGSLVKSDDALILSMMKNVVDYLLKERLNQHKKLVFSTLLSNMKAAFCRAGKFDNWRTFCMSAAASSQKKKPLVLILMEAIAPP